MSNKSITDKLKIVLNNVVENSLLEHKRVFSIISDYFGEENVDFQNKNEDLTTDSQFYFILLAIGDLNAARFFSNLLDEDQEKNKENKVTNIQNLLKIIYEVSNLILFNTGIVRTNMQILDLLFDRDILTTIPLITAPDSVYYFNTAEEKEKSIELLLEDFATILTKTNVINNVLSNIYIKFDKVKISNESKKNYIINGLICKIELTLYGTIQRFLFARYKSTVLEYNLNYCHSHTNVNRNYRFESCCLGDGPLIDTLQRMRDSFSCNDNLIKLFCIELEEFTQVESIEGGPYIRFENLLPKTNDIKTNFLTYNSFSLGNILKEFQDYLEIYLHEMTYININNKIALGMPFVDIIVFVTNKFIDYHKKNDFDYTSYVLQVNLHVSGYSSFDNSNRLSNIPANIEVCEFKGEPLYLTQIEEAYSYTTILNPSLINILITNLLIKLNIKYNEYNKANCKTS